ncbi:MAG: molybdenum cofactor guanylyltransferase [Desulfocurvibacter africanus]
MNIVCGRQLAGVVLAGGKSSRLGRDKARILFEGQDLLSRTAGLLRSVTPEVWVIGRDPADHGLSLPWRLDDIPGRGPVGGIITALRALNRPCLVLSCDLPFIERDYLERLMEARAVCAQPMLMTTYGQVETEYIEALVAIYEPEALPVLESAVVRGEHKLSRIVPREHRCQVPYSQEQALPFFNINYPADLALMRKLEARADGQAEGAA